MAVLGIQLETMRFQTKVKHLLHTGLAGIRASHEDSSRTRERSFEVIASRFGYD